MFSSTTAFFCPFRYRLLRFDVRCGFFFALTCSRRIDSQQSIEVGSLVVMDNLTIANGVVSKNFFSFAGVRMVGPNVNLCFQKRSRMMMIRFGTIILRLHDGSWHHQSYFELSFVKLNHSREICIMFFQLIHYYVIIKKILNNWKTIIWLKYHVAEYIKEWWVLILMLIVHDIATQILM